MQCSGIHRGLGVHISQVRSTTLDTWQADQVKKMAKDVGKISAELKQVPEEFNKGMEVGQEELAKKKMTPAEEPPAEAPPTPPPAA